MDVEKLKHEMKKITQTRCANESKRKSKNWNDNTHNERASANEISRNA